MNEITAAIKKKAEAYAEKKAFRVPYDGSNNFYDDKDYETSLAAYTCGGEEWVGFMLKFVEWTQKNYWETDDDGFWYKWCLRTPETDKLSLTDNQFLAAQKALKKKNGHLSMEGLTKREYFAAMAMQGLLANPEWMKVYNKEKYLMQSEILAEVSTKSADALLTQLNTKQ